MRELAVCEVCGRVYPATMMQGARGRICPSCARPLPTPPKVDFWQLADDDGEKPKELVCKDCGKPFLGHGCAKFCADCRARHEKESAARQAAKRKAMKGKARPAQPTCEICGAILPDWHHRFCADCAAKRANDRMAAWRQAHKDAINAAQRAKYHARKAKEADNARR